MTRALIVLNPSAGAHRADEVRHAILGHLVAEGWTCDLHETTSDERITPNVRQMLSAANGDPYTLVVASGGDGTLAAVAGAVVGRPIPLGVVPSGTGNSLARDLRIPLDVEAAVALLTGPHALRHVDAMHVGGSYHFLNMSIGISAAAILDAGHNEKRYLGIVAYVVSGLRKLIGMQPARFELEVDGNHRTVDAGDIVVANSGIVGITALRLAPDILVDDGRVGVCIIRARTILDYAEAAWRLLLRQPNNKGRIECFQATETVRITSNRWLPVQADGEPAGYRKVTVHVVPRAVAVIVPNKDD